MEQWEKPMCGSLRITNLKTLEKWVKNGKYQAELDMGYIYAPGCGRFRVDKCTCSKCRKTNSENIKARLLVIERHLK